MRRVVGIGAIIGLILLSSPVGYAVETRLHQTIVGTSECTVDTVLSDEVAVLLVQPRDCEEAVDVTPLTPEITNPVTEQPVIAAQSQTRPGRPTSTVNIDRDGDQAVFEQTVIEPLASWVGIGNPDVPIANPVVATLTLGGGTAVAYDAAILRSLYAKRTLFLARRVLGRFSAFVRMR